MDNIFDSIFDFRFNPFQDKEAIKKGLINDYINGKITKAQLDEKMKSLT